MVRVVEVIEECVGERVSLYGGDGGFDGLCGAWERDGMGRGDIRGAYWGQHDHG